MSGAGPSVQLLRRLIAKRLEPGADQATIDQQIRDIFEETWTVVFTDLEGFSRSVTDFGIIHFLSVIHRQRDLLAPLVEEAGGLLLKEEADSWLLLFRRPAAAVATLVECQRTCARFNEGRNPEDQVRLCAGIGYGAMLKIGDDDVWGREVNLASKLGEEVAANGEILLTEQAAAAVADEGLELAARSETVGAMTIPCYEVRWHDGD